METSAIQSRLCIRENPPCYGDGEKIQRKQFTKRGSVPYCSVIKPFTVFLYLSLSGFVHLDYLSAIVFNDVFLQYCIYN